MKTRYKRCRWNELKREKIKQTVIQVPYQHFFGCCGMHGGFKRTIQCPSEIQKSSIEKKLFFRKQKSKVTVLETARHTRLR